MLTCRWLTSLERTGRGAGVINNGAGNETVADVRRALRAGSLSSVSLVRSCLDQICATNWQLNAFVALFEAEALEAADCADRERAAGYDRGVLHGIPIALKDNIDYAGKPVTCCSAALNGNVASEDAECVARLREAGAIIVGKTNMHELAYGGTGQISSVGPARNPWDTDRLAGGSSSGSAVAVASGMVPAALGSDTGGSVRIPAAACGLVGFKPSFGRISTRGVIPLSWTLDHVGPIVQTSEDAALLVSALTGDQDLAALAPSEATLRIGVARFPDLELDPAVNERFRWALDHLQDGGHRVEHFNLTYSREAHRSWLAIIYAEAANRFEKLLDKRYYDFDVTVRTQLEAGRHIGASTYLRAQRFRAFYGRQIAGLAADYDLLCMPTLPTVAPKVGQRTVELPSGTISTQNAMTFSNLMANMLGWPAITLPMATREGELPVGMTLLRPTGQDQELLENAMAIEALVGLKPW